MQKKELTHEEVSLLIKEATVEEELAVPLYTSHIKQTLFWSALSAEKREQIIEGLKVLERDSIGHAIMLRRVEEIYRNL